MLDYVCEQQIDGLYWIDKWHISPHYATAHALCVLNDLPDEHAAHVAPAIARSQEWLRQTQNGDGSWGFYGRPTLEETAYALLALAQARPEQVDPRDRRRCNAAVRYLKATLAGSALGDERLFPPLWIDKCLYTPPLVVRALIESALLAARRRGHVAPGAQLGIAQAQATLHHLGEE